MVYDKRHCVSRAEAHLLIGTPEALRYAALELRTCMELLTYEKLRSFEGFVPESVLATWQPPQAVKALLEFDEVADQSFTIEVGVEKVYGQVADEMHLLGHHTSLRVGWLRKHYHKVGSLLHAPLAAQPNGSFESDEQYLQGVLADLKVAVSGTILGARFTDAYHFTCSQCGKPVARNRAAVKAGKTAQCFTPGCDAEYKAIDITEEKATFEPVVIKFECSGCHAEVSIAERKVRLGVSFKCPSCGKEHGIVGKNWVYAPRES